MDELKNFLEVVSLLLGISSTIIASGGNSPYRQLIKRSFWEAIIITGTIVFFSFDINQPDSIFDYKTLYPYGIFFLVIFFILICSNFILYRIDIYFKGSKFFRSVFVGSLILLSIGIVLVVDNSDSNIEFLEDTPAKIVDSNGREYDILIPKSTTIVWNDGSIINK